MSDLVKVSILAQHGIETRQAGNRLYALAVETVKGETESAWVDVSDWTGRQLMSWLNY